MKRKLAALIALASLAGCVHARPTDASALVLRGTDGSSHRYAELSRGATAIVFIFFSATCPCQRAHDARISALAESMAAKGARIWLVDSELDASVERDQLEAHSRGYRFPILLDPGATLARSLGADAATTSIVVDAKGEIRYRGALDSDRTSLHDDATPYLANAIEAVLSGRAPDPAETHALGCALQGW